MRLLSPLILCLLPLLSWGQTHTEDYVPYRDVEATDSGIVVTYTFRGGIHQIDPLHEGAKFWKIPGFGLNDNAGEPGFPFRWDSFTIPDNADVLVTLLDSAYTDTLFTIAPAYPPLLNSDTIGYTSERVPAITPYTGFYPNNSVQKGEIQSYRGQGLVRVATLPVQYNFQTGTVRTFSRIKYLVSFTDRNTRSKIRGRNYVSERADSRISLSDHFLDNTTLNYKLSTNGRKNVQDRSGGNQAQLDNRSYLIITTNDFLDAVNEFAEWKRTKGFNVIVESRNNWTYSDIHNKITFYYLTNLNNCPLYHVLLVGDIEYVPAEELSFYDNCEPNNSILINYVSDYNYGTNIGETDRGYPVIHRGRIPVKNNNEASIVLNKIIQYEKNPSLVESFYNNCVISSYFQNSSMLALNGYEGLRCTLTSEELHDYLTDIGKSVGRIYTTESSTNPTHWNFYVYAFGDTIPSYLLRSNGFSWNGDAQSMTDNINDGRFLIIYNGHGYINNWLNIGFGQYYINSLTNGNKLPVVFSMSCQTGKYNYNLSDCLAELFLKKENGGCVAFYGSSEDSHSGLNDVYIEAMIDAIWPGLNRITFPYQTHPNNVQTPTPTYELGQIMDQGLKVMDNNSYHSIFSSDEHSYKVYNQFISHLFGDPSMMIYTIKPQKISNPSISVNGNIIHAQTSIPNARITFYTPGTTPIVNSYIGNSVDYTTTADSVIICIDDHNRIPYVVTYHKNLFIQNENINDTRTYVGKNIMIGKNVTTTKPEGDVLFNGAHVEIRGGDVIIEDGTTIKRSNVVINPQ